MIKILMATYNGEKYLEEQIESLFKQTYQNFNLYICDDKSTDGTVNIIKKFIKKYPSRVHLQINDINSGSPKHNFFNMIINIKSDYIMLCDQDDVWLPQKIEKTLEKINQLEESYGKETPILVHTDLKVVDRKLDIKYDSYKKSVNANYDKTGFNQILIQNIVAGCTAIYNRALADLLIQEPDYCIMHDWWIALVASAFGKLDHIKDQTILYRQHGENAVGVKSVNTIGYKIKRLLSYKEVKKALNDTYIQAKSFMCMYNLSLNTKQQFLLKEYIDIPNRNKWNRWRTIIKLDVLKNGISRKIANFLFI